MLKNYFKIAFRTLQKNKAYTLLNVLGLSVGIAGALLVFLYVFFHYSTDRHHPAANKIYRLVLDIDVGDGTIAHESGVSVAIPETLEKEYTQVERSGMFMFFYSPPTLSVDDAGGEPKRFAEQEGVAYASEPLLYMLDFEFLQGNKATALQEPAQAVITATMARKLFNTEQAVGKSIRINNRVEVMVSGVVKEYPKTTDFKADVLLSLPTLKLMNPTYQMDNFSWTGANNWVLIQLAEGYQAADLENQLADFRKKYLGEGFSHWQYHLQALSDIHFDERYGGNIRKSVLYQLTAVGLFLLLIACINFINLSTASATLRQKEVGVRKVMGSSRGQIFWQFIAETALIILAAIVFALLIAYLLIPKINTWLKVLLSLSVLLKAEFLITGLVLSCLLVLLAGAYPALVVSGFSPAQIFTLTYVSGRPRGVLLRKTLVTGQFIMAQVFVIGAWIAVHQMDYFLRADPGFAYDHILTVSLPAGDENTLTTLRNTLMQHSDVENVSMHFRPPMAETNEGGYVRYANSEHWAPFMVRDRWADEHFLETFEMELVAGRNIQIRDSVMEFLINEDFVEKLGLSHPEDVLNKPLMIDNSGAQGIIVGVVRDFHQQSLQQPIEPVAIYPFAKLYRKASIKLQTYDLAQSIQQVQAAWEEMYPDQIFQYSLLDANIARMYQQEATAASLIRLFAVITIIICCLGLYGLSLFTVNRKVKEIGIRKVLGASLGSILLLLSKDYVRLIGISFLLAVPLSNYIFTEWLQNFSYRIELQWWYFVMPGLLVLVAALLTISQRTFQAARKNPVDGLRNE